MPAPFRSALVAVVAINTLLGCLPALTPPGDACAQQAASTALPSWNDVPSRRAIVDFVDRVTRAGGPDYIPTADRITVFDNDGTLWCEQPMYVQLAFVLDRVRAMADEHPEWRQQQPFRAALANDLETLAQAGQKGLLELVMATHAGMTTDEFSSTVSDWIRTAKHPRFKQPYTQCVYQPMIERLAYLRAHGFKTFIVSGGGVEFLRVFTETFYGVPPEQVIGTSIKTRYEERDGQPVLVRLPQLDFLDDKVGKPVAINAKIGRRPVMAFGNSDGDFEMLKWTTSAPGPRFGLIVHHTDADREYAYDCQSTFGRLDRAMVEARQRGWVMVDMKPDWKVVFAPQAEAE